MGWIKRHRSIYIFEGLESVSVSLSESGVSTNIKIGNKRRAKEAAEIRKAMVLRSVGGASAARFSSNPVTSTFSNKFMGNF